LPKGFDPKALEPGTLVEFLSRFALYDFLGVVFFFKNSFLPFLQHALLLLVAGQAAIAHSTLHPPGAFVTPEIRSAL